jgi:hypothetical protein
VRVASEIRDVRNTLGGNMGGRRRHSNEWQDTNDLQEIQRGLDSKDCRRGPVAIFSDAELDVPFP